VDKRMAANKIGAIHRSPPFLQAPTAELSLMVLRWMLMVSSYIVAWPKTNAAAVPSAIEATAEYAKGCSTATISELE